MVRDQIIKGNMKGEGEGQAKLFKNLPRNRRKELTGIIAEKSSTSPFVISFYLNLSSLPLLPPRRRLSFFSSAFLSSAPLFSPSPSEQLSCLPLFQQQNLQSQD